MVISSSYQIWYIIIKKIYWAIKIVCLDTCVATLASRNNYIIFEVDGTCRTEK